MEIEPQQIMGFARLKHYLLGFLISIVLTLAAYFVAVNYFHWAAHLTVALLGLFQAWLQLSLFLHLGREPKPRWNLVVFLFTLMVTLILVFGSVWIMENLNYNLMEP